MDWYSMGREAAKKLAVGQPVSQDTDRMNVVDILAMIDGVIDEAAQQAVTLKGIRSSTDIQAALDASPNSTPDKKYRGVRYAHDPSKWPVSGFEVVL